MVGIALGSAGGMKRIQEASQFFDDTFLVLCGDAFVDFDVKAMLDFHRSNNSVATILMRDVPPEEVSKYGVGETSDSGQILQFQEKPAQEEAVSTMISTGIYMFEPSVFDHIPSDIEFDIGGELFPALVDKGENFFGVCQDFQWIDIGTLPDFFDCQERILKGEVNGFKLPGKEIAPGIFANIHTLIDLDKVEVSGPVYIGAGSCILPGAVIEGPAIIGSNCIIEPGAKIKKSYIDSYKRVRSGAVIDELILHDKYAINRDGSYHDLLELKCEWMVDDARNIDPIGEFQEILADEARRVA